MKSLPEGFVTPELYIARLDDLLAKIETDPIDELSDQMKETNVYGNATILVGHPEYQNDHLAIWLKLQFQLDQLKKGSKYLQVAQSFGQIAAIQRSDELALYVQFPDMPIVYKQHLRDENYNELTSFWGCSATMMLGMGAGVCGLTSEEREDSRRRFYKIALNEKKAMWEFLQAHNLQAISETGASLLHEPAKKLAEGWGSLDLVYQEGRK